MINVRWPLSVEAFEEVQQKEKDEEIQKLTKRLTRLEHTHRNILRYLEEGRSFSILFPIIDNVNYTIVSRIYENVN